MTEPDSELLGRYGETRDDRAIAELVRRYLDLVYTAALRQLGGDAHLAQEVAQDVFVACARKAAALRHRDNLVGWLHTSTHFAAAKCRRAEHRRRAREAAYSMNETIARETSSRADWSELRPVLDAAMQELAARDRETVLLRYFERRSVADVGRRLGLTENAAAKVIERALDRLRERIGRRGIASGRDALAFLLTERAVTAAPGTVASAVTNAISTAVAGSALAGAGIYFMSKTTITVITAGALILASSLLNLRQHRRGTALEGELAALKQQWIGAELATAANRAAARTDRPEPEAGRAPAAPPVRITPGGGTPPVAPSSATPEIKRFGNRGRDTPIDLLETLLWATARADAKTLAEATLLNEADTALVRAWFDELPEEARAPLGSPEIATAAVLLSFSLAAGRDEGYVQILQQWEADAETLRLRVRRGGQGGFRDNDELVRRFTDGWKVLLPPGRITPERKAQFQETARSIAAAVK